ncbi:MAG: SDR family oxidoreductase [Myxococcota bacterium]|jgi:NAD(P)-dependent dehydrogenase (short-subunit alcohol dehydrogenase family)|nr:short-chain dehydrogenase [Deltaproteobacteria bacterium]MCP4244795.1 SDR family oxidoreductase [bacterium]MDP6074218.1 SDR family oxidoreductase [Myxococcota bacterium]MBT39529.1 short-chain dehydrogenase [Deltaproteobacteria bacterium]MDP6242732.1 SDR family oxidoreductase [Myxococcota bacterium]
MGRLDEKVGIVTGSASGIGRATAIALAREGASVVVADIDEAGAKQVQGEITEVGGHAIAYATDVSSEPDVRDMVTAAIDTYGGLDILHNNAAAIGRARAGDDTDVASLDVDVWERTMAVNLRGVMLGCKHAIPRLLERGGGSIINTSSGSAERGDLTLPAYAVSKSGVNTLTLYVAAQYGKRGIRCNAISPGLILTHPVEAFGGPRYVAMLEEHHLTPRVGRPEDIANAAVFLASDESSFITGQVLRVDGGILSHAPPVADIRRMARDST